MFHETTARRTLGPMATATPLRRMAETTFHRVIGRLHAVDAREGPQRRLQAQQVPAHRRRLGAAASHSRRQPRAEPRPLAVYIGAQRRTPDGAVAYWRGRTVDQ